MSEYGGGSFSGPGAREDQTGSMESNADTNRKISNYLKRGDVNLDAVPASEPEPREEPEPDAEGEPEIDEVPFPAELSQSESIALAHESIAAIRAQPPASPKPPRPLTRAQQERLQAIQQVRKDVAKHNLTKEPKPPVN